MPPSMQRATNISPQARVEGLAQVEIRRALAIGEQAVKTYTSAACLAPT
jgi:hypothetical protein